MSLAVFLKILSDCCIGFALLGSGPVSFGFPLLLVALFCGVIAGLSAFFEEKGWTALRVLCGLLPSACLLLAENGGQLLILAAPALYTALVILRGKLALEYYSFRHSFLRTLGLLGLAYLIVNIWNFLAMATNSPPAELDPNVILRYGLAHLFCGILLQRYLRLGVEHRSEGGRNQIAGLLGVAGAVILLFLLAEPLLRQSAAKVMEFFITLLFAPVMLLVQLFSGILEQFGQGRQETPTEPTGVTFPNEEVLPPAVGEAVPTVPQPIGRETDPTLLWALAVTAVLLAAAVILLRTFRKRQITADTESVQTRLVAATRKQVTSALSGRNRVRQFYREFLRVEKGWGMKLSPCDTSQDILRRIHHATDRESAARLRQIYLRARYDHRRSITRNQVAAAKKALKGTRQKKSSKL